MLLHSFLDYWAREQPDCEFAVQHGRSTTYGQARDVANQLAHAFLAAGLRVGDRIAILVKNRVQFVRTYLAASKADVVPVPLNYRVSPPEWGAIMADAEARVLITEQAFVDAVDMIRGGLRTVERFVTLD